MCLLARLRVKRINQGHFVPAAAIGVNLDGRPGDGSELSVASESGTPSDS